MNRIFSGVQPTGNLHLGNYLGAIRNWVALQKDYDCIFCIVDLHALTVPQDPAQLKAQTREVTAAYIASGIDPERCKKKVIFNLEMVPGHAELATAVKLPDAARSGSTGMTQFKEKAGKQRRSGRLPNLRHPVLIADIILYKADACRSTDSEAASPSCRAISAHSTAATASNSSRCPSR